MTSLQFYKYTTWTLLLLNIAMISFFFLSRPPMLPANHVQGENAIDILKLDKLQNETFLKLVRQHIKEMDGYDQQQKNLLRTYFKTVFDSTNHETNKVTPIIQLEAKKIESTYQHFKKVEALLSPEQQVHFKSFVEHALSRILLETHEPQPPQ